MHRTACSHARQALQARPTRFTRNCACQISAHTVQKLCAPAAGVALGYNQLTNQDIMNLPVPQLQHHGYLFVWVINASFRFALQLFAKWGYT